MEQLTKNQAVATSQEAVQNQNEPQLRDENAHNDKSVHGRSEERFSRNAETDLVCRLLLEKKKNRANLLPLSERHPPMHAVLRRGQSSALCLFITVFVPSSPPSHAL